jgi:hypothetical protein
LLRSRDVIAAAQAAGTRLLLYASSETRSLLARGHEAGLSAAQIDEITAYGRDWLRRRYLLRRRGVLELEITDTRIAIVETFIDEDHVFPGREERRAELSSWEENSREP